MSNTIGKKKMIYILTTVVFLAFIIMSLVSKYLLERNHLLSSAIIYEVRTTGRSNTIRIAYKYNITGKVRKSSATFSSSVISLENTKIFEGKSFPLAYHPSFTCLNTLLILPEDFKQFSVRFPDSLKWILPLMNKK